MKELNIPREPRISIQCWISLDLDSLLVEASKKLNLPRSKIIRKGVERYCLDVLSKGEKA